VSHFRFTNLERRGDDNLKSIAVILLSVTMNLGVAGQAAPAEKRSTGAKAPAAPSSAVTVQDVTQSARIRFTHNHGAYGKKYLPETMGPGVAFIDYDNDGWPDICLVNGTDWPGHATNHSTPKLYHNNHDGTFTDVTQRAGLGVEMFGMGVAVGDFDNDGFDGTASHNRNLCGKGGAAENDSHISTVQPLTPSEAPS
jgi:hypothetical protein